MLEKERVIIVDVEGVVADGDWRRDVKNFDESLSLAGSDGPFLDVIELVHFLADEFLVVGIASAPERYRKQTMDWLLTNGVAMDEILMRGNADYRPEPVVKMELIRNAFPDLSKIVCVMEDRDDVVEALRGAGITTLQIFPRRIKT